MCVAAVDLFPHYKSITDNNYLTQKKYEGYPSKNSNEMMKTGLYVLLTSIALLSCLTITAQTHVEFVTPSIVRIQWSPDGVVRSNSTGTCVYVSKKVPIRKKIKDDKTIYTSEELIVIVGSYEMIGIVEVTFKERFLVGGLTLIIF